MKILLTVRFSKNINYEKPYNINGIIKQLKLKQAPKYVCKDRNIGTRKGINRLGLRRRTISSLINTESGATTYENFVMKFEEQALDNMYKYW